MILPSCAFWQCKPCLHPEALNICIKLFAEFTFVAEILYIQIRGHPDSEPSALWEDRLSRTLLLWGPRLSTQLREGLSTHPGCFYKQVGNWSCLPWGFSSPDVGARLSVPVGLFIHPFSTVNWAWDACGGSTDEHADQVPVFGQVMVTATRQGAPLFTGHVTVHWPPAKFPAGGNVLTGLPPTTVSASTLWICTAAYYFSFRITCSSVCAVAVRSESFFSFFLS